MNGKRLYLSGVLSLLTAIIVFGGMPGIPAGTLHAAPRSEVQFDIKANQPVSINKAGIEELQLVRGIGPSLAERIVNYRDENGKFESLDDLTRVRGIGRTKLNHIKEQVKL